MPTVSPSANDNPKLSQLLDAAMDVFLRFGFKKTSMSDVAEEAGLSRQGLYFHFDTKEALFKATIEHWIHSMQQETRDAVSEPGKSLEARLLGAFDRSMGRTVGKVGAEAFDLAEASDQLADGIMERALGQFHALLVRTIDEAVASDLSAKSGVCTSDRVDTLLAASMGLKHRTESREAFRRQMLTVVRVVLAPLKLKAASKARS